MRKALFFVALFLFSSVALSVKTSVAFDDRWIIEGSDDNLRMRKQHDYDYSNRYRGSRDEGGSTRLRNPYTGDTLRGHIDDDGYGYLRDWEGNRYRVRPR
jgi:hypothetical protein